MGAAQRLSWWLTLALTSAGVGLVLGPWLLSAVSPWVLALPGPGGLRVVLAQLCFELGLLAPAGAAIWAGKKVGWLQSPWEATALLVVPPLAERLLALTWGEPFANGWGWHGLAVGLAAMVILGTWRT